MKTHTNNVTTPFARGYNHSFLKYAEVDDCPTDVDTAQWLKGWTKGAKEQAEWDREFTAYYVPVWHD